MSRPVLNLKVALENVHCHDEGDGWGNAEPYLWPVFFKIDGDSFAVDSGVGLIGTPIVVARQGRHGNLGTTDVDEGDDVSVPAELGEWQTTLRPIPVNDPVLRGLIGDDLDGIAGVVAVLMEEDGWPGELAEVAYAALVNAVQLAVTRVAASFQHAVSAPTPAEIDAAIDTVKATAAHMVRDAVKGEMSGWQLLWYGTFGNNDDTVGSEAWTATTSDFEDHSVVDFDRRWDSDESGDGDWALSGSFVAVAPCPAEAVTGLLRGIGGKADAEGRSAIPRGRRHDPALAAMRKFRAGDYRTLPGLEPWWRALTHHAPEVTLRAARDPELRTALDKLISALPAVLAEPDRPLGAQELRALRAVLKSLSRAPRVHDAFVRRALVVLPEIEGKSWNEAISLLDSVPPSGRGRGARKRASRG